MRGRSECKNKYFNNRSLPILSPCPCSLWQENSTAAGMEVNGLRYQIIKSFGASIGKEQPFRKSAMRNLTVLQII